MTVKMRVEYLYPSGEGLMVRSLEQKDFRVLLGSRLGGAPLRQFLTSPRALKKDGTPDLELFVFSLVSRSDIARFKVGEEVLFEEDRDAAKA